MLRDEVAKLSEELRGCKCKITTKDGDVFIGILETAKILLSNKIKLIDIWLNIEGRIEIIRNTNIIKMERYEEDKA